MAFSRKTTSVPTSLGHRCSHKYEATRPELYKFKFIPHFNMMTSCTLPTELIYTVSTFKGSTESIQSDRGGVSTKLETREM